MKNRMGHTAASLKMKPICTSCSQPAGSQVFLLCVAHVEHHVPAYLYGCLKDQMGQEELGSAGEMLAQSQLKSDVLGCCREGTAKRSATQALVCLKPQ